MGTMQTVVTFVTENYGAILAAFAAVLAGAMAVAKLTPTPKDDAFIARVQRRLAQVRAALARLSGRPRV